MGRRFCTPKRYIYVMMENHIHKYSQPTPQRRSKLHGHSTVSSALGSETWDGSGCSRCIEGWGTGPWRPDLGNQRFHLERTLLSISLPTRGQPYTRRNESPAALLLSCSKKDASSVLASARQGKESSPGRTERSTGHLDSPEIF